jgi:sugar phosphate isomerase/epimerase
MGEDTQVAMKLAAITDEISQDFEHALDVIAEYGATGAELRGLWGANIADLDDDQVARAKSALRSRSMRTVCLATPFYKCDLALDAPNPGEEAGAMHLAKPRGLEQQMEMLKRCIRIAHEFDTSLLRVFSFWRKTALTPEVEARIVDAFGEPIALAEKEGVTLVLENEHACFIGTGADAARIAGEINSPHLKLVWDPGNAFSAGEHPFPDGYETVKPWMVHMHVKDGRMVDTPDQGPRLQWCVIGEGEIDYVGQFAALRRDSYQGYVSLETHYVPKTGSGEGGKGTPEDGSRPCLAALQRFLAE